MTASRTIRASSHSDLTAPLFGRRTTPASTQACPLRDVDTFGERVDQAEHTPPVTLCEEFDGLAMREGDIRREEPVMRRLRFEDTTEMLQHRQHFQQLPAELESFLTEPCSVLAWRKSARRYAGDTAEFAVS